MAMLLFLFLIFIIFLGCLYFLLIKLINPIDRKIKDKEFKKTYMDTIKQETTIKRREIDALSRSIEYAEEKKQAEKELEDLLKLYKNINKK